jgi:hypothetical protein
MPRFDFIPTNNNVQTSSTWGPLVGTLLVHTQNLSNGNDSNRTNRTVAEICQEVGQAFSPLEKKDYWKDFGSGLSHSFTTIKHVAPLMLAATSQLGGP